MGGATYGYLSPGSGMVVGSTAAAPRLMDDSVPIRRMVLSPDGRLAAAKGFLSSGKRVRSLIVWDTSTGKIIWHQVSHWRGPLVFAPDSRRLAVSCQDGVSVWDVPSNRLCWQVPKPGDANSLDCLAWSPDGRMLATTCSMFQTALMDAETGAIITRVEYPHRSLITSLNFSPDSGLLAVGCESGGVLIWNLRDLRRELAALKLDWDHPPVAPTATWPGGVQIQMAAGGP